MKKSALALVLTFLTSFVLLNNSFAQAIHETSIEDADITTALVQATLRSEDAQTFVKYTGFDTINSTTEIAGRIETLKIEATGLYLYQGDIGCGELKLTVVRKTTRSPGIDKVEYTTTLDTSGLSKAPYCKISLDH